MADLLVASALWLALAAAIILAVERQALAAGALSFVVLLLNHGWGVRALLLGGVWIVYRGLRRLQHEGLISTREETGILWAQPNAADETVIVWLRVVLARLASAAVTARASAREHAPAVREATARIARRYGRHGTRVLLASAASALRWVLRSPRHLLAGVAAAVVLLVVTGSVAQQALPGREAARVTTSSSSGVREPTSGEEHYDGDRADYDAYQQYEYERAYDSGGCQGDCYDMDNDGRTWNDVDADRDGLYESY